jgi:hypothetical protein
MTTTETIGCPFYSNANEVTSPDLEYTKVFNTNQHGAKSAKYTCNNCNEENVVYWTKI